MVKLTKIQAETLAVHVFEKAGLGKAPFRFIGYEHKTWCAHPGAPVQVGGSCDYCSQGISNMFYISSSDGRTFKVGSECVNNTGDAGLKKAVNKSILERKHALARDRIAAAKAVLESNPDLLTDVPHPNIVGKSMRDYVLWLMRFAGETGMIKASKIVEKACLGG